MIKTKFQEIYKTKYPIVQAGMGPYDTEKLCIAVAKAGALGLISTVGMGTFELPGIGKYKYSAIFEEKPPNELLLGSIKRVIESLKDYPDAKFGVNIPVSEEFIPTASKLISTVLETVNSDSEIRKKLIAIFTSAGDPLPWSENPGNKKHKYSISIKENCPSLIWTHVVPSVRAAKRCEKANIDVIVASGREGGAHVSWRDVSSMVLIPEVVKNVKKPVIAAGGFTNGDSLIAALALGAIGVQMGTRFIATVESDFKQEWKEFLVQSNEEDSIIGRGFFGPMRFLRNPAALELIDATLKGASDLYRGIPCNSTQEIINLEVNSINYLLKGDKDKSLFLGGSACGRIHNIPYVKDLIENIMQEAENVLKNICSLLK
ncbi:MAG: NAD(P)H-dependent flavin oxidoreductase [Promethearchaeota archaeon]